MTGSFTKNIVLDLTSKNCTFLYANVIYAPKDTFPIQELCSQIDNAIIKCIKYLLSIQPCLLFFNSTYRNTVLIIFSWFFFDSQAKTFFFVANIYTSLTWEVFCFIRLKLNCNIIFLWVSYCFSVVFVSILFVIYEMHL